MRWREQFLSANPEEKEENSWRGERMVKNRRYVPPDSVRKIDGEDPDEWQKQSWPGSVWPREFFFMERFEVARPEDAPDFWAQLRAEECLRKRAQEEYKKYLADAAHRPATGKYTEEEDRYRKRDGDKYEHHLADGAQRRNKIYD